MNREKGRENRDSRERAREKKDMVVCWGRERRGEKEREGEIVDRDWEGEKRERGRESRQRLGGREEREGERE